MNTTTFFKNKIRQILPILFMLLSFNSFADNWTEDFNDQNSNSYGTSFTINGRVWTCQDAGNFAYANSTMGSYGFTINDDKSGANITTPSLNTCGTVSFKYAYKNGNETNVFLLQKSTDGTTFTTIDTHTLGASSNESYVNYSFDVNESSTTIFIRILSDNQNAHLFIDDFTVTNYSSSTPTITVSPTSLTGLDYTEGSGPSSIQSFTVEGSNLTADIAVTPSTNYEISTDNTTFQSTVITLTQSSGAVASTTIYTRLKAGLTAGNYNENITCASTGADSKTIACSGTVTGTSTPIVSDAAITESDPYYAGDNVTLTWNSNNVDYVNIYVFIPEDNKWEMFLSHTASDGSEVLSIPADASYGTTYKLMVAYVTDTTVNSETSEFEIRAVAANISDLRNNNNVGDKVKLTGNAVVTYIQSYRSQKYIQDANAAILIDDNSGIITSTYAAGDEMPGLEGTLNEYRGMLQFIPIADPGNPTASGLTVTPTELTLSELNSNFENYEAQLVTVKGIKFTSADGSATFANGSVYPLANSTDTFDFRTSFYNVNYISTIIPSGKLDITGILNARDNGYITARGDTDIVDIEAPVSIFNPTNAETNVAVDVKPTITFNENIYKSDGSSFSDNEDISSYIAFHEMSTPSTTVDFTATISEKVITITPSANLNYETKYHITLLADSIADASGNKNSEDTILFTTASANASTISNVAITESAPYYAGDNITLTWNSNNVDKVNVYVFVPSDNEWMLFENNIDSDGSEELTIPADAGYGTTYKVMVAYVTDTTVNSETNDFEIRAVAATITDLRNNNNLGDIVKLSGNAVVTYAQNFRHQKYIQDANAAIIIDDQSGVITTTYTVGDQMTGLLGKLSEYGGMLQFIPQADPGQPTATGVEITPQVITITEFNSNFENYESELITIKNVAFVSADGTAIFENGKVYFVKNNGDSAAFRTTFYGVDYIGNVIPDVEGNVTGIVNQRNDGNYFTARNSDDLNFDTGVYKVTFNITDENSNALSNAQVIFNQDTISTSFDGKAVFNNIEPVTDAAFKVVKENYQTYEGTVTVTDANVTVDVTLTAVGINENQSLLFDIYPNPSNGKIHVNFNENINNIQLVVTDVRGKVIVNKKINQNENMIDLSGNKPGIYFIRVNNKDNVYTGKIILK